MVVVFPSTLIWTAAGSVLNRFFTSPRWSRVLGIVLGALLASTVIFIWI
jgi:threonine/homoserine/homoserine lactone efflux protein